MSSAPLLRRFISRPVLGVQAVLLLAIALFNFSGLVPMLLAQTATPPAQGAAATAAPTDAAAVPTPGPVPPVAPTTTPAAPVGAAVGKLGRDGARQRSATQSGQEREVERLQGVVGDADGSTGTREVARRGGETSQEIAHLAEAR